MTAIVLISFDDTNDTDITVAAPYLQSLGLVATTYTIISAVDGANKLSEANLNTLKDTYGWSVAGHGSTDLTTLSSEDRLADLNTTKSWLKQRGFSWRHYSYPLGGFDRGTRLDMGSIGMRSGRTTNQSPHTSAIDAQMLTFGGWGTATKTYGQFESAIKKAVRLGMTFSPYSHRLQSPTSVHTDPDVWKQMMELVYEYKQQGLVQDMNIDDYYNGLLTGTNTGNQQFMSSFRAPFG